MKNKLREVVRKYAQKFADTVITKLQGSIGNEVEFNKWYQIGIMLNAYCINKWEIYLD